MATEVNEVILTAKELQFHIGENVILDKASLSIHEGDRIGLIGRNGAGKSTFLKIISGLLQCDSGEVAKKKNLNISILSQEFTLDENKNVYENILLGAENELELLKEYEKTPYDSNKKHILEEELIRKDSWNLDKRIDYLIKILGTPEKENAIVNLSGGEKRRIALCRALISKPDLLILDEPTNHLDTLSIEWIENFLAGYQGTCIFVTHDRYFLDRIANRIVELSSGTFFSHQGNYTDYLINKSERQRTQEVEERKRQNFLKRELEWIRRGPKARTTKAKSRIDNFYEVSSESNYEAELEVELIIPPAERLGKKVVELKNVGMKFGEKTLFEGFNHLFEAGKKIGVVGRNGTGKTTLLKLILGEITTFTGKIEIGETTKFNYINQSRLHLNDDETVIKAIGDGSEIISFGNQQVSIWTYLKRFLFTDDRINTLVGRLSGGEKSRLTLAKILSKGGNFLMLDEPTNDLDLPTLRILEEALIAFEGCALVVSHDRYFLNRVCDGIIVFEDDGKIFYSDGDYNYYVEKRKSRGTIPKKSKSQNVKSGGYQKPKQKKLSYKDALELEQIEAKIVSAEEEVERIESIFSSPDFYNQYKDEINELNEQLESAKENVKSLYDRWEQLEKLKEEINKL
ncbi:MAG: ATP-binding cassette domain-containing protein [Melioribacteraceae bacterium]|nr:ATP-binding cassette domain-containing protein [Melioribacteraceae bacterium]MCF8264817.1 ATP-binding cassette domain-containing protein [Melioribacteraceae bacterium]MCF8430360.1 ATP-binding cassette domain-containing protein [Melioribacteraceae bacterium]